MVGIVFHFAGLDRRLSCARGTAEGGCRARSRPFARETLSTSLRAGSSIRLNAAAKNDSHEKRPRQQNGPRPTSRSPASRQYRRSQAACTSGPDSPS